MGPSAILVIGGKGGDLFVYDAIKKRASKLSTRRLRIFDGNHPHMTYPYTGGTRYSIVFFDHVNRNVTTPSVKAQLKRLGFNVKKQNSPTPSRRIPQMKRLNEAVAAMRKFDPVLYKTYMKRNRNLPRILKQIRAKLYKGLR